MLFNAVFRTNLLISTLFLENPFNKIGLGISATSLSNFSFLSFFPSLVLIFLSPIVVNRWFSDRFFLKMVVIIYMVATLMTPTLKDILVHIGKEKFEWLVFLN